MPTTRGLWCFVCNKMQFVVRHWPYRSTHQVYENAMSEVKRTKMSKFKKNWGWVLSSPPTIALIFAMVLFTSVFAWMYSVESNLAPGEPSPFSSKCNMWNRCG